MKGKGRDVELQMHERERERSVKGIRALIAATLVFKVFRVLAF